MPRPKRTASASKWPSSARLAGARRAGRWTEGMVAESTKRRGYSPVPTLPALAGRIVDSADVSDRFARDVRRTLADMWADSHYGTMADLL
ncbi:MAG TPA: glycosyl hydrolase [Vicinamibacterales bacterium]|nr:glycosyl hydrolase [Vicinamibacterales bacterium]